MLAGFPALTCLITKQDVSLNHNQGFYNPWGTLQRIYPLPLKQGAKFTALFLAEDARKLAVIPAVEMCQILMELSIEKPLPEDVSKIDIVVLRVTLKTEGISHINIAILSQLQHKHTSASLDVLHTNPHRRLAARFITFLL